MNTNRKFILFAILISFYISACHSPKPNEVSAPQRTLADSLFLFIEKDLSHDDFVKARNSHVHEMDSDLKARILVPIILADKLPIDPSYSTSSMLHCDFIARMTRVRAYTPIVIHTHGDDYNAFYYAVLDSNLHTVSHYLLTGFFGSGEPDMEADSLVITQPTRYSAIKGANIYTYDLTQYIWRDSLKNYDEYDSISYISHIDASANFITTRQDSIRFRREKK